MNRSIVELFEEAIRKQGLKRIPVGPAPLDGRTRKKASARKKSATRRTSGARSKSRGEEAVKDSVAELFAEAMRKQGFKPIRVGPGPVDGKTRKKASARKKSATRRTSGARSRSRGKKR